MKDLIKTIAYFALLFLALQQFVVDQWTEGPKVALAKFCCTIVTLFTILTLMERL